LTEISTNAEHYFERYAYPDWLWTHSLVVGRIAETIAMEHRDAASLDTAAVGLAGYLHDIGKSPLLGGDARQHNELSALVLAAEGLHGCVEPSRRHPIYSVRDPATAPRTLAEKIVYVADRRGGQRVQSVEERARDQANRHPRFAEEIARDIPLALALEGEVFAELPFAPSQLEARLVA
jgi:HD superfamily phosphodiesterase